MWCWWAPAWEVRTLKNNYTAWSGVLAVLSGLLGQPTTSSNSSQIVAYRPVLRGAPHEERQTRDGVREPLYCGRCRTRL